MRLTFDTGIRIPRNLKHPLQQGTWHKSSKKRQRVRPLPQGTPGIPSYTDRLLLLGSHPSAAIRLIMSTLY